MSHIFGTTQNVKWRPRAYGLDQGNICGCGYSGHKYYSTKVPDTSQHIKHNWTMKIAHTSYYGLGRLDHWKIACVCSFHFCFTKLLNGSAAILSAAGAGILTPLFGFAIRSDKVCSLPTRVRPLTL